MPIIIFMRRVWVDSDLFYVMSNLVTYAFVWGKRRIFFTNTIVAFELFFFENYFAFELMVYAIS